MNDYAIKTPQQLGSVLQGFRKARHFSQQEVGAKAALPQPVISQLEAAAGRASVSRILKVLAALDLELVIRPRKPAGKPSEW
jgi:HTH-type transcriptional regulator/antitoxin HipB